MSEKNFVAYGDAESILTGYANRIKQSPTTFVGTQAQWNALSLSQKAEYTLVDITDDEFSPNNFVDWGSYSILGAKNLLPVTMASQVLSGVTFTVDSASGIIGVSGNNSGTPFSDVIGTTLLKPGTYKVTTGQATELNAQIGIAVTDASSGTILARSWNGTEVFTISSDTQVKFHIEVNVTGTITSTTIYPTCKLDSIKDESYVPYAMTNRELSSQIQAIANIDALTWSASANAYYRVFCNHIVELFIHKTNVTVTNQGLVLGTLPSDVPYPSRVVTFICPRAVQGSTEEIIGSIGTDGKIGLSAWATVSGANINVHIVYLS